MSTLKNVGKTVQSDSGNTARAYDLVDEDYISTLIATNLSQGTVDSLVASSLSPYASIAYANTAMSVLATPAYVITNDTNYIPLSTIGQPSGPIALDAGGKVPVGLITTANTQRWPAPFWTPATYASGPVTTTAGAATQLFTSSQPYPGFTYKLMVTGMVDASVALDNGEYPQVLVRQGSTTGPIVASGYGIAESYLWGAFSFSAATESSTINSAVWAQYGGSSPIYADSNNQAEVAADAATVRVRNLDSVFGTTIGDNQIITMTLGSTASGFHGATNDIYGRMDSTGNSYVRCQLDGTNASLFCRVSSGSEVAIGSPVSCSTSVGDVYALYCGTNTSSRQFLLYKNGSLFATWNDANSSSVIGAAYRGWGFGMTGGIYSYTYYQWEPYYYQINGQWTIGYNNVASTAYAGTSPYSVASLSIVDPANPITQGGGNNYGMATIIPTPLSSQSALTGATTLYVMLSSSGSSSTITSSTLRQSLWIMPVPA